MLEQRGICLKGLFQGWPREVVERVQKVGRRVDKRWGQRVQIGNRHRECVYVVLQGEFELSLNTGVEPVEQQVQSKQIHSMSVSEKRDAQRQVLFRKLDRAHTKPKIIKSPL